MWELTTPNQTGHATTIIEPMAHTFNNNNSLNINLELPSLVNNIIRQRIFGRSSRQNNKRYSIRILLSEFAATGYYFVHVELGGIISVYNKEEYVNYTPLEESLEVFLHDGTKVIFPINLDSEESVVPPDYDSDGNEIREDDWDHKQSSREDSDESGGSTGSISPPSYNSDSNEIL